MLKSGKYTLHQRIEILAKSQKVVARNLMAIKWLGNTGTHESAVTLEDLLNGYEIMEHTLGALLQANAKRVASVVRELTQKHARKRRKAKKRPRT